jgi:aromatic ring-opening dioxygenase catalytic subunit (LigB family)
VRDFTQAPVPQPCIFNLPGLEQRMLVISRFSRRQTQMGKIVAAMATMHAPQLFTRPPEEDPKKLDAGIAAMRKLGEVLDETKPDALVILASDHLETFFLQSVPTFAVIAGERANTAFAGRTWNPLIHQALAEDLLEGLVHRDFDMAYSQDALLGHSFAAPFEWILGSNEGTRDIPVVPIFVNTYLPPLPRPQRCAALGRAIAEIVAGKPERVALLASGGMSHYPGTAKYYQPAYDFDRWCIRELENSHTDSFLDLTPEQLDEVGNTEMLPWAIVLGAVGAQHMELLSYQETSHHGHAVARFHPGEKANAKPARPYQFQSHPYRFYDHPPLAAYRLNKLLYDSRHKPALRQRMFRDVDAVSAEYGLGMGEASAMRAVFEFRNLDSDRPALDAEPVVAVGAHPVGALMAVHGLQQEKRAMRKPAVISHDVALAVTH